MKHAHVVFVFACFILALSPFAARGRTFTLSDSALMKLDYDYSSRYVQGSIITNITDIEGAGVRFDILYYDPLNSHNKNPTCFWTSSIYGGIGALTGRDISEFDDFALKITVVSASGVSNPTGVGPVVVGASINQTQYAYAYQPQTVAFNDPYTSASATSVTATDASQINLVGFNCNIPYWWYNPNTSPWDPQGARISLLVEPAPGAVVITPEPASAILIGAGLFFARLRRRQS